VVLLLEPPCRRVRPRVLLLLLHWVLLGETDSGKVVSRGPSGNWFEQLARDRRVLGEESPAASCGFLAAQPALSLAPAAA